MARKVIILNGDPLIKEELTATEAIIPGHLIEFASASSAQKNTQVANQSVMVALERDELGKGIDDAYAASDVLKHAVLKPGDRFYGWLASGHNVAAGDFLAPQSGGLMGKTSVSTTLRVAQALEAVNTSGSAPVAGTRIRVQVV